MAPARDHDERSDEGPAGPVGAVAPDALHDMTEAVVVCDARGRIVAANDALHALLGYEPGALLGKKLEKLVPEDLRDLHRVHRTQFVADPGPGGHRGGRLFPARHRDGRTVAVDISIANLHAAQGGLSVALLRDLSDPEAAGRQVRHLAALYAFMAQALSLAPRAATPTDLWASVCDAAVDHGIATLAWVGELRDDHLEPVAVSGPLARSVDGLATPLGADHPAATAVSLGSPVVVPDLSLEPAFAIARQAGSARSNRRGASGAGSLCAVPVRQGGAPVAVLALVSPLVSGFSDEAVTMLEWLGAELSATLDRLVVRHAAEARAEARLAELTEADLRELDAAVTTAVADALAAERAAVGARALEEGAAWARALEQAVADARAAERLEAEAELRAAQVAIEQATEALERLQGLASDEATRRHEAVTAAVEAARAEERSLAEARERSLAEAHRRELADALDTTRAEERTAAAVRARYAEDAHERNLAKAVEAARAEERAAAEARQAQQDAARRAAEAELAGDAGRAARLEAHAAHGDVAVQLALLALSTGDPVDVAEAVVGAAGRTLGVDSAVLIETDADEHPQVRAAWFGSGPSTTDYESGRHADLHDVVVAHGSPVVVSDLAADRRFHGLAAPDDHAAGIAVMVGGAPGFHGSLSVLSASPRAFDPDEVALLERLAEIIAASFERARDHAPAPAAPAAPVAAPVEEAAAPPPPPAAPPAPQVEAEPAVAPAADPHRAPVTDPLTGLPTRALLIDRAEQLLARLEGTDPLVGVLVARVDGLGEIIDAHGRGAADALLVSLAERLRRAVETDAVVARTAGDALAVLLVTDGTVDDFTDLADRVRVALGAPHAVADLSLAVTTSIGVSIRPATDAAAEQLVEEAEAAAARAGSMGRGRTELYDHDLRRQARRRLDQASALRRAIDDDELVVVWQAALPLQPAEDEQPEEVWAEALVRWRNPERGLVSPGNFIALAEETGLIVPVGDAVLRMALEQLVEWRAADGTHPSRVAVNLSPRQLAHDGLAASVAAALDAVALEPSAVMFEITESAVTAGPEDAIRRLNELRDLGVGLAMDDFGTGYSSLGYLRRMPVSVLKIDQSFIRGLTTHRADWAIVHGIVEMAHGIGLTVVAEGIETAEQLDHLVALGCDRGQGYLWSSPVPAEALDELLAAWSPPGQRA